MILSNKRHCNQYIPILVLIQVDMSTLASSSSTSMKNIRVSDELHQRIKSFGRLGEQYQDVIARAFDALEREEQQHHQEKVKRKK